jgi:hypothetical protein
MTTIRVRESGTFAAVTDTSAWTEEELVAKMVASSPIAWREFSRRYDRLIDRCIMKVTRRFSSVVTQEDVAEIAATLKLSLLANDMHKLLRLPPYRSSRAGEGRRVGRVRHRVRDAGPVRSGRAA